MLRFLFKNKKSQHQTISHKVHRVIQQAKNAGGHSDFVALNCHFTGIGLLEVLFMNAENVKIRCKIDRNTHFPAKKLLQKIKTLAQKQQRLTQQSCTPRSLKIAETAGYAIISLADLCNLIAEEEEKKIA